MGLFTDGYGCIRPSSIVGALAVGIAVLIGNCSHCNGWEYSEGVRAGVVNKLSRKGFFSKTYEGQIALEGIVSGGQTTAANVWDFSLDEQEKHGENIEGIAAQLDSALRTGKKVQLIYKEVAWGWPWRGSKDSYVLSVKPLGTQ